MELIEISRGHLKVRDGDRIVTIYGEAFLRGHGSPDFVVYSNTIEKWDAPFQEEVVSKEKKEEILRFIREEFERKQMTVEIE